MATSLYWVGVLLIIVLAALLFTRFAKPILAVGGRPDQMEAEGVRKTQIRDKNAIAKMTRLFMLHDSRRHEGEKTPDPDAKEYHDEFVAMELGPQAESFVYVVDGKPIGFISGQRDNIHIANLAVLPEYEGRGIGGKLLAHMISVARDRGASLSLDVSRTTSDHDKLVSYYTRRGFDVTYTTPGETYMRLIS